MKVLKTVAAIAAIVVSAGCSRQAVGVDEYLDSVKGFEYRSRKQAEALERARLLNEQAEQLREQADKLGSKKQT